MHAVSARCSNMGRKACSSVALLDLCSLLLVENTSRCTRAMESYSAEQCMQGRPAPLPVWRTGAEGQVEARMKFLSSNGGGEVCWHVN